jgi:dihydrodipicolinate synthase/N-acetylneuraminate lyase
MTTPRTGTAPPLQLADPAALLRPRRRITGMSAILLPLTDDAAPDWDGFAAHVARTAAAGLTPAVNMDTGYINLLDDATAEEVLRRTREALGARGGEFVAGAFVDDSPGSPWNPGAYLRRAERIQHWGGTPVVFQSYGLTEQAPDAIVSSYAELGRDCPRFVGFELGTMFAPFGRIYDLETYGRLMEVPQCIGAKHSSLDREQEWARLRLRDERRPDFQVLTGNDLAIDMVMYGSDYLLGLSTFAPDHFARRDALWAAGDPAFYELNDLLQYLGHFAFRAPVPAYKHSAAQFLKIRGWIGSDRTHPRSPWRSQCDLGVLKDIARRLEGQ